MASVREAILLVLLGASITLLVLPFSYIGLTRNRHEEVTKYRKRAHGNKTPSEIPLGQDCQGDDSTSQCDAGHARGHHHGRGHHHSLFPHRSNSGEGTLAVNSEHREADLANQQNYIKEIVFGGLDGLLTMVAVMLGGIGADLTTEHIFALGLSNLIADAFSLGFGEYVSASARYEFSLGQQAQEYSEVKATPMEEISEMVETYISRGLSKEDALLVAKTLSRYEDFWVRHMMLEELGIEPPDRMNSPVISGAIVFATFILFGMIPLLGVGFSLAFGRRLGAEWYRPQYSTTVALIISALTLFFMGLMLAKYTGAESAFYSGAMLLFNGTVASAISFSLSTFLTRRAADVDSVNTDLIAAGSPRRREPLPSEAEWPSSCHASGDEQLGQEIAQVSPWPLFRRRFLRGLCLLWFAVSPLVVLHELTRRRVYESMRVFGYGLMTCITTGFGVFPLLIVPLDSVNEAWLAGANSVAAGMMLAASAGMLLEAHDVSGPGDWQIFAGLAFGVVFIMASQRMHGSDEEAGMEALCGCVMEKKHFKRAVLIFTVMFCHSAAEGVAVGVAFDQHCEAHFGLYVSLLLALQNIPEGLAVALVLVPRGVDIVLAALIAVLTSVPQPLMAVAAFRFVETFQSLLPIGLAFAAGAMIYVSVYDLLAEASEALGRRRVLKSASLSFCAMLVVQAALQRAAAWHG